MLISIEQIIERIYLVKGENRGKFPFSHSVLIDDDVCVLIDTGCGRANLEKIQSRPLNMVLNSHSHIDHTSGNWLFPHIPMVVPKEEFAYNGNLQALSQRYVSRELSEMWRTFVTKVSIFRDAPPSRWYREGDLFDCGHTRWEAIHTPGHSIGHHCFYEREKKILFSSDIDLTRFGPWYGNEESSIDEFLESIERVRKLSPEIILSSHRGAIREDIDSKLVAFAQVIEQREENIYAFLTKERTVKEIVDRAFIYGKFPSVPSLLKYWERIMVLKHLHRLMRKGDVVKTENGYKQTG